MTSVAVVQAYSKINAAGQWVDRSEHVDLNALFEKMTAQELEVYAQNGTPGDLQIQLVVRSKTIAVNPSCHHQRCRTAESFPLNTPSKIPCPVFGNFAIGTAEPIGASPAQEFLVGRFTRRGGHLKGSE